MSEPTTAAPEPAAPPAATPAPVAADPGRATQTATRPNFEAAKAKAKAAAASLMNPAAPPAPVSKTETPAVPVAPAGGAPAVKQIEISLPDDVVKKMAALEAENRALKKPAAPDQAAELRALWKKDPKAAIALLAEKPDAEAEVLEILSDHYVKAGEPVDPTAVKLSEVDQKLKDLADAEKRRDDRERADAASAQDKASRAFMGGILDHNAKKYPRLARPEVRDEAIGVTMAKAADIAAKRNLDEAAIKAMPEAEVTALVDEALAETDKHYAILAARWWLPDGKNNATVDTGSEKSGRQPNREAPQTQAPPISKPPLTTTAPKTGRLTAKEATEKARAAAMALVGR